MGLSDREYMRRPEQRRTRRTAPSPAARIRFFLWRIWRALRGR